jgi:hypothetical protein
VIPTELKLTPIQSPIPPELYILKLQIDTAPDSVAEAARAFYSQLLLDRLSIKTAAICTSFRFFR